MDLRNWGLLDNYDTSTIEAGPAQIFDVGNNVLDSCINIANYLNDIFTCLQDLRLDWTGGSATAAADFNNRWNQSCVRLLGTTSDPGAGAANVLCAGLMAVGKNYAALVQGTTTLWNTFGSGGGSSGTTILDQVTNTYYHTTSVNEVP
jgi:hypothetical protein